MRKFTRIQKRLLTTIVVLCILACAMFGLRQNSITNIGYSVWTYLKYGLIQYPLSSIGNAVNDFANLWHAYDDNEYLSKQLAEQKNYQTAYEDERNKNKQLEGLLEMKGGFGDSQIHLVAPRHSFLFAISLSYSNFFVGYGITGCLASARWSPVVRCRRVFQGTHCPPP